MGEGVRVCERGWESEREGERGWGGRGGERGWEGVRESGRGCESV